MADITINYGENMQQMTAELMQSENIAEQIKSGDQVCIKPNLVVSRPADGGATTHPEIIEGIILYLQENGIKNIIIAEGSWVGDSTRRAFDSCGYTSLSKKYGVPLIDTKSDDVIKLKFEDLALGVCKTVAAADYLINVPVLKGHCQTDMTCCLKNMKGCIPDSEKRRYHTMGLHRPIAALNAVLKPNLHIVDSICGDLTFEEGGNPVESGRIMLGYDPVLLDSYGAKLMGYYPEDIGHVNNAQRYGVGHFVDSGTEIVELNADKRPKVTLSRSSIAKRLAGYIDEDSACSACYAALIFALNQTGGSHLKDKIKIGQGFRGEKFDGIGVGNCTSGCSNFVKGCPPTATDIVELLKEL